MSGKQGSDVTTDSSTSPPRNTTPGRTRRGRAASSSKMRCHRFYRHNFGGARCYWQYEQAG
eukprot:3489132-Amphidinium_carterae.1